MKYLCGGHVPHLLLLPDKRLRVPSQLLSLSVSDSAHRYRDLLSPGIRRGENTGYFQFNAVKTRRIQAYYNDLLLCVFKNIQMQNWVSLHRQKRIQWTR